MRNIYLLWGLLTCIAFTSCYEEDALTPTEGGIELRFKVPQGTNSWDDDISQIQKDFGVYLIYKDLQDEVAQHGILRQQRAVRVDRKSVV